VLVRVHLYQTEFLLFVNQRRRTQRKTEKRNAPEEISGGELLAVESGVGVLLLVQYALEEGEALVSSSSSYMRSCLSNHRVEEPQ
jgi:hypothetical protein